jgi:SAM-dependent methyltransferase
LDQVRLGMMRDVARPEDIRLSFNEVAETYDQIRPSYPDDVFDVLFAALPDRPHVIEVGPGTGQATRSLLARGARVHAIEIGPAMAAKLRSNLAIDRLTITVGDFERVDLPAQDADAVFSASAYHWIPPQAQISRPAHLLRDGGILATADLIQVDSAADRGFFAASQPIYERYGQGHQGPPAPLRAQVDPAIRTLLEADDRFGDIQVHTYDWDQTYSASEYRDLMLSFSVTQMMDRPARSSLLDDVQVFVEREFDGYVTRPLVVALTTGALRSR